MTHRFTNVQKKQYQNKKHQKNALPVKSQQPKGVKPEEEGRSRKSQVQQPSKYPVTTYTYSVSFLLKLKDSCTELPRGGDIPTELLVPKPKPNLLKSSGEVRETYYRNVVSLLNKLTPENFQSITEKLVTTLSSAMESLDEPILFLSSIVEVIFEKAVRESRFADLYAQLCVTLSQNQASFKKLLLHKCQQEFESPPTTIENSELDEEEIKNRLTERNNGVPQFIGALFLRGLISEKIIHYCLRTLLTSTSEPDVIKFASLLMLIGKTIDHPKAKILMDAYFVKIESMSKNKEMISIRTRFKLSDVMDLRRNNWQPKKLQIPPPFKSDVNKQLHVQEGR